MFNDFAVLKSQSVWYKYRPDGSYAKDAMVQCLSVRSADSVPEDFTWILVNVFLYSKSISIAGFEVKISSRDECK